MARTPREPKMTHSEWTHGVAQAETPFDTDPVIGTPQAEPRIDTDIATGLDATCDDIRSLQRQRVSCMKARVGIHNRLNATVRVVNGYNAGMEEAARTAARKQADDVIAAVFKGDGKAEANGCTSLILNTKPAIVAFCHQEKAYTKAMVVLAKGLPVAPWIELPQQRGFGMESLAVLVGEAGNLNNYANPGKLWRRFGLWPIEKKGLVHMPSQWKRRQKTNPHLSSEEWEDAGYCPRRRSVAYLWGEALMKQNHSIYRQRYDDQKAAKILLDWPKIRAHRHGMTLATKLLIKHLWAEWTGTLLSEV